MIKSRHRLSYRQAMITVFTVFVLGLAISFIQLVVDFRAEEARVDTTMHQVMNILYTVACTAAYNFDNHLADQVVRGLFEYEAVFRAQVKNDFGAVMALEEHTPSSGRLKPLAVLFVGEDKTYSLPLFWGDDEIYVGEMSLMVDTYQVTANFFDRAALIFFSGVVRNLILSILLTAIFYFILTKPLLKTVRSILKIDPSSPEMQAIDIPHGHQDNELGLLVKSVNEVLAQYRQSLDERKKAQAELGRMRHLLESVIDSMPSVLVGIDAEGSIIFWNREAEAATGLPADKAYGCLLPKVHPLLGSHMDRIQRAIAEKSFQKIEKVVDPGRDQEAYLDITIYPLFTAFYEGVVIRVDDITERVRMEKLMIQSEKMLSVGGLAAGMAHEINNPLAGILQNIQVIRNRFDMSFARNQETAQKYGLNTVHLNGYFRERGIADLIETVQASGRRAARIVENMLSFSRKGTSRFEHCDLADLLDKIVDLVSNDYDIKRNYDFRRYEVIREYETDLPKVACEGNQIQQVVLNLLKNGVQAMDRGGGRFTLRLLREDRYVRLEVEDNGPGMEEAIRKRVFEPFFTTKEVGVGTGLGLSVSYFIITETHGGLIDVESSPGKGAKFIIKLPLDNAH